MSTLKDVAKLAGVSVATASRVLNNNKNVSPENHHAIMSAMKTLNYTPNYLGRSLRMSSSKKILVLLPTLSNQFYSRVALGIEDMANAHSYNVMIGSTHGDRLVEENYINLLFTRLVDGLILFSTLQSETRLNEIASAYPIVQCCEYKNGVNASRVIIDNKRAAYDAVRHIIECGHRKIAIIAADDSNYTSRDRTEGYRQALAEQDIPILPEYIVHANYSSYTAMRECEALMQLPEPPTAIFCISDGMAIGAMRKLSSMGYRICDDVAVVGFD
ncbi:MAG: LacI family DNA-binding transcriptional regulator, partial [Acetanaerobacterium sp.]